MTPVIPLPPVVRYEAHCIAGLYVFGVGSYEVYVRMRAGNNDQYVDLNLSIPRSGMQGIDERQDYKRQTEGGVCVAYDEEVLTSNTIPQRPYSRGDLVYRDSPPYKVES